MKSSMKVVLLGIVLVMCTVGASANAVDPSIIIRDPVSCAKCVVVTGNSFSFSVPSGGFGQLSFLNASGANWTNMVVTEIGVPAINVSCNQPPANLSFSCSVVPFGTNGAKMILTATGTQTGIPNGHAFEILLACSSCPKWPAGLKFNAVANVPEPGTMALLLTGIGAIYTRRKRRAKIAA